MRLYYAGGAFAAMVGAVAVWTVPARGEDGDALWMGWLENGFPNDAVLVAQNLTSRAAVVAHTLPQKLSVPTDIDVVCGGGGNYDGYYMGVSMVLSRVNYLNVHRYAGASAGGMMPFEIALKGELQTLQEHLSYGILMAKYPGILDFGNMASAAALQDHHWRLMSDWMTKKWEHNLSSLDGKIHLALSCLDPILPKLVMVSNFTSQDQADHAFMGTGTMYETYDGMACSDGGAMSGKKMTPLFQDKQRGQLIVDLMATTQSYPSKYSLSEYASMIQKGQDDAAEFLATGKCSCATGKPLAITYCPLGSKTSSNICEHA